jgi:hypothetical protein
VKQVRSFVDEVDGLSLFALYSNLKNLLKLFFAFSVSYSCCFINSHMLIVHTIPS